MLKKVVPLTAGALIATAAWLPAPAASASTSGNAVIYWSFMNRGTGKCMSTYESGAIRALPCDTSANAQEWRWVNSSWNSGYRLLKNRWTGKCLISSVPISSGTCEDWTSRHWKNTFITNDAYTLLSAEHQGYLWSNGSDELWLLASQLAHTEWFMRVRDTA
ncbi:hypothetical protein ABZ897_21170 [Nonomuraea sp. NPDC046802]|uniref:hypothetical protein n=1 Tax=Nonomuraea sp. NPDC046802 TaxID=3154919 RepID=UPI0034094459